MLAQIQAPRPIFIPPPQLGGALANITKLLGTVIDPNRGRRREIENFLLQNPEIGAALAAQQEQEEAQRRETLTEIVGAPADQPVEVPVEANVLEAYGFSPEQASEALRPFRGMAQQVSADQRLQVAQRIYEARIFERAAQIGTPEALAEAQASIANRDRWMANLDTRRAQAVQPYIDQVLLDSMNPDPEIRAEAERVQSILTDPNIEGLRLRAIDQLLEYQRLGLQERIAQVDAGENALQNTLRMLSTEVDITRELRGITEQLRDASTEEKKALSSQFNQLSLARTALRPGSAVDEFVVEEKFGPGVRLRYQVRLPDPLTLSQREQWTGALRQIATQVHRGEAPEATGRQALQDYLASEAGSWLREMPEDVQSAFAEAAEAAINAAQEERRQAETAITTPEQAAAILAVLPPEQRALVMSAGLIGKGFRAVVGALKSAGQEIPEGIRTISQLIGVLAGGGERE